MTDIATLGFALPTAPLVAASSALNNVAAAATSVSAATSPAVAGINAVGAAAKATAVAATAQASALNVSAAAHGKHGAAANNNAIATLELFHVTRSLTEQFAMGVSPLRALTMEMGRIMTLFQFAGGPSGVLSLVGSGISKVGALITGALLNPLIGIPVVLGAVGAAGLVAFGSWESKLGEMQKALNGLGRSTGLTLDQLGALAEKGAARGNISTGSAVDLATQAAATGKIAPDMISRILDDTKQFAKATGQGIGAAGSQLVTSLADPTKGAQDLDKALGFLNDTTKQTIIELDASGKRAEAQDLFIKALNADTATASDRTWTWTRAWQELGNAANRALADTGKFVASNFDPTLQQQYDAAKTAMRGAGAISQGLGRNVQPGSLEVDDASAQSSNVIKVALLAEQLAREGDTASIKAYKAAADEQSKAAGTLVRSLDSNSTAYSKLTTDLSLLNTTSANAAEQMQGGIDIYGRLVTGAQRYAQTVEQVTHAHDTFITSFQREIAAGQIEIESIGARTLAEKAAVDVARERLALMGQQITASEAEARVEQKLTLAIAGANKQVEDNSRQVANAAATAGMSGIDLQRAQLDQKYRLLSEQAGTSHTITMQVPVPPVSVSAGIAGVTSATQSEADRLVAGKSFPAGAIGPNANGPNSAFGDLSKSVGGVGSAASNATPTMQTYTKTIVDGGNASQIAADKAREWATIVTNATKPAIDNATKSIDAQGKMLDVQIATFGQSAGAIAAANEKQQLLNQFASEGITEAKIGAPAYAALVTAIDGVAKKSGEAATASEAFGEKQKEVIGTLDLLRSTSSGALSTFTDDVIAGKSALQTFGDVAKIVLNDLLKFAENSLIAGLFGQSGTTGTNSIAGGGIAGWLGKLVGIGGSAAASGAASASGTGLVGGLNFANPVGLASGGVMTSRGMMPLRRYASGGVAASPQLAMFGEGSSPEAYVPLPDGRSIPVSVKGGRQQANHNIVTVGDTTVVVQGDASDRTLTQIRGLLAQNKAEILKQVYRGMPAAQQRMQRLTV